MEKELIPVIENDKGNIVVSARELYLGLGLHKSAWARWYRTNIIDNGGFFIENVDYMRVQHHVEGNEIQDFAITLDFAKHLAMMAKTDKSYEYREYLIKIEKEKVPVLTHKDRLYINIGRGGSGAIGSAKELVAIETLELKYGVGERWTSTKLVGELNKCCPELCEFNMTTTEFHKWLISNKWGGWKVIKTTTGKNKSYFEPNENFNKQIANEGFAVTGISSTENETPQVTFFPSMLERIKINHIPNIIKFISDSRKKSIDF